MKNIHILPTDKPSRLHFTEFFEELVFTPKYEKLDGVNIYITNDEEIKEGTWSMSLCDDESYEEIYQCKKANLVPIEDRKIILTTEQDLIKDGVQAIDDEFLEWFVKNPSCEEVEVINEQYTQNYHKDIWYNRHKIIIPKEEPKQETLEEYFLGKMKEVLLFGNDAQAIRFMEKYFEAKQEFWTKGEQYYNETFKNK